MSKDRLGEIAALIILPILVGILINLFWQSYKERIPVQSEPAPNYERGSVDIELFNPSIIPRLVTEIRFYPGRIVDLRGNGGNVDEIEVVFEKADFDAKSKCFRKTVNNVQVTAEGRLNSRFYIRDPKYAGKYVDGKLEIDYGDRSSPTTITHESHPLKCLN